MDTFICLSCGKSSKINFYVNRVRFKRTKYCVTCLPRNQNAGIFLSLNNKKMKCSQCGKSFKFKSNTHNTTTKCIACWWRNRHRINKSKAIKLKGGKCQNCGYNKYNGALAFHHIDPNVKEYALNRGSWTQMNKELKKCVLLCFNCHQELHGGVISSHEVLRNCTKDC
jgi:hypothetical protein